ncbi:MAG: hypothetical protein K8F53_12655 [Rhodocyclaceae bacterium]|nr:hypothetical protein [Rhodocyclaceae bacterium]
MSQANEVQLIESVCSGKFSERELINLYKNAATRNATAVMDAVKIQMRADFPRAANRMFGAKESEANALLEDIFRKLAAAHDFTANRLKNGVKAGGEMISGKKHIDVYISYKNGKGFGAVLGLVQDDPESELTARVGYYKTGNGGFREAQVFQMHDFTQAVEAYKAQLSKVLSGE